MSKKGAIAEVFVTAFKSLPEKENIVEKLLSELDSDFTKEEWEKIRKITEQQGKISSARDVKHYVQKL